MSEILYVPLGTLLIIGLVFFLASWRRCNYTWTEEITSRGKDGRQYTRTVLFGCSFNKGHEGPHGSNLFGPAPGQ